MSSSEETGVLESLESGWSPAGHGWIMRDHAAISGSLMGSVTQSPDQDWALDTEKQSDGSWLTSRNQTT